MRSEHKDDEKILSTPLFNAKVENLLEKMSLREKVGQMIGIRFTNIEEAKEAIVKYCIGSVGIPVSFNAHTRTTLADITNNIQKFTLKKTRLGIPILFACDAVHGHALVKGSTVFPHNLALAATWNLELVEKVSTITAREVRATGIHLNYDPICDIARDIRWGRTYETFGESPYLCTVMAVAKVKGYQGEEPAKIDKEHVVATAKHFPAYSSPERGQDASPVDISEYTLRTVHLLPFQAVIKNGVGAVMPCYNEINGTPVHGSRKMLTELLRRELGFRGIVVSDWSGVEMLHKYHRTAETLKEAVRLAVEAGIDIFSVGGEVFARLLTELVEEGEVSESRIDESVYRILEVKFKLGLFDDPYVDPEYASKVLGCKRHRRIALEAARESITLLKNEGNILPLSKNIEAILVTGPNADNVKNQLGGWSNVMPPLPPAVTILEGIKKKVSSKTKVYYAKGSSIRKPEKINEAKELAKKSNVAIVVVGEPAYVHEFWTQEDIAMLTELREKREITSLGLEELLQKRLQNKLYQFPSRALLDLPEGQLALLEAICETGTPTVTILISGRPLTIKWAAENIPAILMAYLPGIEGGHAVADVLFGDYNPSGKLPVSIPYTVGQLPIRHNYKHHPFREFQPMAYNPLFEFGFGLSYTKFEYYNLIIFPRTIRKSDFSKKVEVHVTIKNVGDKKGTDVVQLYISDLYSSKVVPTMELKGFKRITLKPNESKKVEFTMEARDLAVLQDNGEWILEPGAFEVMIGGSSKDIKLKETFEITN
ncbi:TPA: glycosyl hydrolase [Candidatus Poribacteria bacterium]|nr:glycosyl hydrolase [Candidatus Poribacteria bacterium]